MKASNVKAQLYSSSKIALWFCFLTFPLVVMKVDYLEESLAFRWQNLLWIFCGTFLISWVWRSFLEQKKEAKEHPKFQRHKDKIQVWVQAFSNPKTLLVFLALLAIFPQVSSGYQVGILVTAMMYITLGLGLNIVVGMAGLLDLGYVAFYAVGAYTYALINLYLGWGFWSVLILAGLLAAFFGVMLGIPVLRLRGDYLAIVTLGFGEIIRLFLENEGDLTQGPSGVSHIPKPGLFGFELDFNQGMKYIYYITLTLLLLAIIVTKRLQSSRTGRAWLALRENEIAAEAMGVNLIKTKLTAFGLGAFWAGLVGMIFAAKSSFVNPASFAFHESAIILSIVVLGGMGSVLGVILAALILVLLPEYLRFLAEYRMLIFGAIMVIMMVFRPQGLINNARPIYEERAEEITEETHGNS